MKKRIVIMLAIVIAAAAFIAAFFVVGNMTSVEGELYDNSDITGSDYTGYYAQTGPRDEFRKDNLSDF